jgi:hypothetical protein
MNMRLREKIQLELDKKGWGIPRLHQEIEDQYGKDTIDYTTLWRMLTGKTTLRRSNHFYIASALGTTPQALRKGTNEEDKKIRFTYNEEAYLEYETINLPYLTANLFLLGNARTETESDPIEKGDFTKWLYALQGETTCIVETDKGLHEFIIKGDAEGTVKKAAFSEADKNGVDTVEELIKKGVLEEASDPGEVRLRRNNSEYIIRPYELAASNFDQIWHTLQQFPSIYFNSTFPHHFENRSDKKSVSILIQYI